MCVFKTRYVLLKDAGELQRHIEMTSSRTPNLFGMDGSRSKKRQGSNPRGGGGGGQGTGGLGTSAAPQGPSHSGRGAGGAQSSGSLPNGGGGVPNTAVYVSNLPSTVTWAVLDMLFSAHGRVRKIKIYRDGGGLPKGDALITFVKPVSVGLAIGKLNGFKMGELAIKVEPAAFPAGKGEEEEDTVSSSSSSSSATTTDNMARSSSSSETASDGVVGVVYDDSDFDAEGVPLFRSLPLECKSSQYPTCVLRNVYSPEDVKLAIFYIIFSFLLLLLFSPLLDCFHSSV
jgi:hypothetical protein